MLAIKNEDQLSAKAVSTKPTQSSDCSQDAFGSHVGWYDPKFDNFVCSRTYSSSNGMVVHGFLENRLNKLQAI